MFENRRINQFNFNFIIPFVVDLSRVLWMIANSVRFATGFCSVSLSLFILVATFWLFVLFKPTRLDQLC